MTTKLNAGSSSRASSPSRFFQLDAIRGIAALCVVVSHYASVVTSAPMLHDTRLVAGIKYLVLSPMGGSIIGLPAVLLFFILSGFALTKMLQISGDKESYLAYVIKRITRIWPPYLVSIALTVGFVFTLGWPTGDHVTGWLAGVTGHPLSTMDVLDHVLLLGAFAPHYNFVAWTLIYEMRISLLFPLIYMTLLSWTWRKSLLIYGSLSFVSVALHYAVKAQGYIALSNWLATTHYTLFFVVGGLIALNLPSILKWYAARSFKFKMLLLTVIVLGYTYPSQIRNLGGYFEGFPMILTHWVTLPSVTLIVVLALVSIKTEALLLNPALQWLGKISYSLYLFHPFIMFLMMRMVEDGLDLVVASLLGIAISVGFAAVTYRWIELPSQRWGRSLAGKMSPRVA